VKVVRRCIRAVSASGDGDIWNRIICRVLRGSDSSEEDPEIDLISDRSGLVTIAASSVPS